MREEIRVKNVKKEQKLIQCYDWLKIQPSPGFVDKSKHSLSMQKTCSPVSLSSNLFNRDTGENEGQLIKSVVYQFTIQ